MKNNMKEKLSQLAAEVKAFSETYKAEIANVPYSGTGGTSCEDDIKEALNALVDAMYEITKADEAEDEEHANSSRANSSSYQREQDAKERR